jgi:AcrR family transcriptional regulator
MLDNSNSRNQIFNAAIDLFARKGFTETSVRDIAREVGIRESTIYNHFSSKADILRIILRFLENYFNTTSFAAWNLDAARDTTIPIEEILVSAHTLAFPPEEIDLYLKAYKILLHEQYRDDQAREFAVKYLMVGTERHMTRMLTNLLESDIIEPCDVELLSKIHAAILYYYVSGFSMGRKDSDPNYTGYSMFDSLRALYRMMVKRKDKRDGSL